jgi:hypothetical protein
MALGVTIGFLFSQLAPWPMAHLLPVVVVGALMDAAPLSIRGGWVVFSRAVFFFLFGGTVAWLLTPWPAILVLVFLSMIYHMGMYMLASGAHLLTIISALAGFVVIPIVVVLLPAVGFIAATGFILDWGIGLIIAWLAWLLIPLNAPPPVEHHEESLTPDTARELALSLTLVLTPLMVLFLVFSWTKVLVAVYAVIFATSFSSAGVRGEGLKSLVANTIYASLGMLICYELFVMVPDLAFMVAVIFVAIFIYSFRMFKGGPTAGFWQSGIFGFLIMLGGILMKDDVVAASTLAERLWQLILATAYVAFAFSVVELYRSWRKPRHPAAHTEPDASKETE